MSRRTLVEERLLPSATAAERARPGRLHTEYVDGQGSKGESFMPRGRFCERYREFAGRRRAADHAGHKAGWALEVDQA